MGTGGEVHLDVRTTVDGVVEIDHAVASAPPRADADVTPLVIDQQPMGEQDIASGTQSSTLVAAVPSSTPPNATIEQATVVNLPWRIDGDTTNGGRGPEDAAAEEACPHAHQADWRGPTVWYRYRAIADGDVVVRHDDIEWYPQNTRLGGVFRKVNGHVSAVECSPRGSGAVIAAREGRTYFISVGAATGYMGGDFTLTGRRPTRAQRPDNDHFGSARTISLPADRDVRKLAFATRQAGEPRPPCGPPPDRTLWYRLRLGSLRRIAYQRTAFEEGVGFAVYRGSSLTSLNRLACVGKTNMGGSVVLPGVSGPFYLQVFGDVALDSYADLRVDTDEPCPDCPLPCETSGYRLMDPSHHARPALRWYFNPATVPNIFTPSRALGAIKHGMAVITQSRNDCGMNDQVSARTAYLGTTRRTAASCYGGSDGDGQNTVSFGDTGYYPAGAPFNKIGYACSEYTYWNGGWRATESDVLLARNAPWTLNPDRADCDEQYDLVGLVAHEMGHVFELDHPDYRSGNQTMFATMEGCNSAQRTLARGDVLGLRSLY